MNNKTRRAAQRPRAPQVARTGVFATVCNRRGVVTGVEPLDGPSGRLHLVHVGYKDDQLPRDEKLIREPEPAGCVISWTITYAS